MTNRAWGWSASFPSEPTQVPGHICLVMSFCFSPKQQIYLKYDDWYFECFLHLNAGLILEIFTFQKILKYSRSVFQTLTEFLTVSYWEPVFALLLSPVFCCFLKLLERVVNWDKMVPYLTEHSVKVNSRWFTEETAKPVDVLRRSPGEGNGNPLQYSCHAWSPGQRSLVGCSPWGCKDLGTAEHTPT